MFNIKYSVFCAALAACLGTGYGANYLMSSRADVIPVECEQVGGKPAFDKTPRPLSSGQDF